MITTFEEWIDKVVLADELCAKYYDRVQKSVSNKQLVDLATDSNGISYLCETSAKGLPLPYEVITSRFSSFINGRYVAQHRSTDGGNYDSKIYCCYQGDIKGDTTLLAVLGCTANIIVNDNHIMQIYVDKNSAVKVDCPLNSKAIVHYWGKKPKYSGNVELIKEQIADE